MCPPSEGAPFFLQKRLDGRRRRKADLYVGQERLDIADFPDGLRPQK